MDDLLELSGNAMKYVMIEERLVESLRMKWEDAKRTFKLEYYIATKQECILIVSNLLITNMSSNARRALTLLRTRSHKLSIEIAS